MTTEKNSLKKITAIVFAFLIAFTMLSAETADAATAVPGKIGKTVVKTSGRNAVMVWSKSRRATGYQLQIRTPGRKNKAIMLKQRKFIIKNGREGVYLFRVRGITGKKRGEWSQIRKFRLKGKLVKDSRTVYSGFEKLPDFCKRYGLKGGKRFSENPETGKYGEYNYTVTGKLNAYSYSPVTNSQIRNYKNTLVKNGYAYNAEHRAYILTADSETYAVKIIRKTAKVNGKNVKLSIEAYRICNIIKDADLL